MVKYLTILCALSLATPFALHADQHSGDKPAETKSAEAKDTDAKAADKEAKKDPAKPEAGEPSEAEAKLSQELAKMKEKMAGLQSQLKEKESKLEDLSSKLKAMAKSKEGELAKLSAKLESAAQSKEEAVAKLSAKLEAAQQKVEKWESHQATKKADASKRDAMLEKPETMAAKLVDLAFPEKSVNELVATEAKRITNRINAANMPDPIKRKSLRLTQQFLKKAQESMDYAELRDAMVKTYAKEFTPKELLALLDAYEAGGSVLPRAWALETVFAEQIAARLAAVEAEYAAQLRKLMSPEATDRYIEGILRVVASSGEAYLDKYGLEESVNFTKLLNSGYLRPIAPIAGESYSDLVIHRDGGILIVQKDDGGKVHLRY